MKSIVSLFGLFFFIPIIGMESPQDIINQQLFHAVKVNDIIRVNLLLAQGADPNVGHRFAGELKTAIEIAVHRSSLDIVKALLDAGADPSFSPQLLCIAMDNSPTIIEILIQHPKTNINCIGTGLPQ